MCAQWRRPQLQTSPSFGSIVRKFCGLETSLAKRRLKKFKQLQLRVDPVKIIKNYATHVLAISGSVIWLSGLFETRRVPDDLGACWWAAMCCPRNKEITTSTITWTHDENNCHAGHFVFNKEKMLRTNSGHPGYDGRLNWILQRSQIAVTTEFSVSTIHRAIPQKWLALIRVP